MRESLSRSAPGHDVVWQVKNHWSRPYSDIQHVVAEISGSNHDLIVKQNRACEANRYFHDWGDATRREYEAQTHAWHELRGQRALSVAEPMAVDAENSLIMMKRVKGRSLESYLATLRYGSSNRQWKKACELFQRLGEWLRHLQSSPRFPNSESMSDELHLSVAQAADRLWRLTQPRLTRLVAQAEARLPSSFAASIEGRWQDVCNQIESRAGVVACHGDFGPWNVLIGDDDTLCVLDFFCARNDLASVDAANILTYLETQAVCLTFSRRRLEGLALAFLRGYGKLTRRSAITELGFIHQRVCRLQDAVEAQPRSWHRQYERRRVIRRLVRQLMTDPRENERPDRWK